MKKIILFIALMVPLFAANAQKFQTVKVDSVKSWHLDPVEWVPEVHFNDYVGIGTDPDCGLHIAGNDSVSSLAVFHSAKDSKWAGRFWLARSRGTTLSPEALLAGDSLYILSWRGYNGTAYHTAARFVVNVCEDYTTTNFGATFVIETTDSISDGLNKRLEFNEIGASKFTYPASIIDTSKIWGIKTNGTNPNDWFYATGKKNVVITTGFGINQAIDNDASLSLYSRTATSGSYSLYAGDSNTNPRFYLRGDGVMALSYTGVTLATDSLVTISGNGTLAGMHLIGGGLNVEKNINCGDTITAGKFKQSAYSNQIACYDASGHLADTTITIASYWSKVYGSLYPTTTTDSVAIGKGTHALFPLDVVGEIKADSTFLGIQNNAAFPTGAGTRMMWIPKKGAFRSGIETGTNWDYANIGDYGSVAMGYLVKASNNAAVALGYNNTSSGNSAFTAVSSNTASGNFSAAIGGNNTASNNYSLALGYGNTASGDEGIAIGHASTASGQYSITAGHTTVSSGIHSFSANVYTTAQAYCSSVFGLYNVISGTTGSWVSTDPLFVIGNGSGTGASAHNALQLNKDGEITIQDYFKTEILKTMHDGANDTLFSIIVSNAVDSAFVATIDFTYANSDGTDVQTRAGQYQIVCPVKAGSISSGTITSATASESRTSGTLTETLSLSYVPATSRLYVIAQYNSSLTLTANKISFTITSSLGVTLNSFVTYNYTY